MLKLAFFLVSVGLVKIELKWVGKFPIVFGQNSKIRDKDLGSQRNTPQPRINSLGPGPQRK